MGWAAQYVGIPFKWDGYTKEGTFCWGLLWMVQKEVFGRELPKMPHSDPELYANDGAKAGKWALEHVAPRAIEMREAQEGDVLHMRGPHRQCLQAEIHVGVFVDNKHVLHIEEGDTGSLVERTTSEGFAWRPIQAYRLA